MHGSGMNPIQDMVLTRRLFHILKKERPDVVLTFTIKPNIYGSLVADWLGIPCICNVSGLGTVFLWKGYVKKLAISLYTFAFRFSSWIFFQNNEDRDDFLSAVTIKSSKTSLLPGSGIDVERFRPVKANKGDKPVFLMIARLLVEKGVYDYIEAIKILKSKGVDAVFQLIGTLDGSHSRSIAGSDLEKWISTGLIEYMEHIEDIRPVIAGVDAVVLPSYREGTPRTLLEAGAMGKALIATNVPGCKHVVLDGKNGFLCKLKNPKDLAAKMQLYLSLSGAEKSEMSENARQSIVDRFDQNLVIEQYIYKINQLVEANQK